MSPWVGSHCICSGKSPRIAVLKFWQFSLISSVTVVYSLADFRSSATVSAVLVRVALASATPSPSSRRSSLHAPSYAPGLCPTLLCNGSRLSSAADVQCYHTYLVKCDNTLGQIVNGAPFAQISAIINVPVHLHWIPVPYSGSCGAHPSQLIHFSS